MIFKTIERSNGQLGLGTNFGNIKDFFTRQNIISTSDIEAIKAYNAQIDACVTSQTAFNRTMLNASKTAQAMVAKANGNTVALGNLTRASKAAEIGFKALSIAGNTVLYIGITKAIGGVIKSIDHFVNKKKYAQQAFEEIAQKAEEAKSNIKSLSDELKSQTKTVNDIKDRYAELAQGVNSFTGENKALSTEEYEEFLNLNEQLLQIFPDLTHHYNSNGDAIANLSGSVDTIVGSLDDLINKQRELANQEIADNLPDVLKGVQAKSEDYEKEIEEKTKELNDLQKFYDRLNSFDFDFKSNSSNESTLIISNLPSDDELREQILSVYESAIKDVELKLGMRYNMFRKLIS